MRLIDADVLIEKLDAESEGGYYSPHDVISLLMTQPVVEERKTGKWRYSRNISSISYSDIMITCDQCGYTKERSHGDVFNFCPSCGAKMEGNT